MYNNCTVKVTICMSSAIGVALWMLSAIGRLLWANLHIRIGGKI